MLCISVEMWARAEMCNEAIGTARVFSFRNEGILMGFRSTSRNKKKIERKKILVSGVIRTHRGSKKTSQILRHDARQWTNDAWCFKTITRRPWDRAPLPSPHFLSFYFCCWILHFEAFSYGSVQTGRFLLFHFVSSGSEQTFDVRDTTAPCWLLKRETRYTAVWRIQVKAEWTIREENILIYFSSTDPCY
jgi:hypothetical protein